METEADLPATDKQLLEDARTIPHVAGHVFDQLWFPGYDTHASVSLLDAAAWDTIAEHCKQAGRAVPKLVNAGIAVKGVAEGTPRMPAKGKVRLPVTLNRDTPSQHTLRVDFVVVEGLAVPMLFGRRAHLQYDMTLSESKGLPGRRRETCKGSSGGGGLAHLWCRVPFSAPNGTTSRRSVTRPQTEMGPHSTWRRTPPCRRAERAPSLR